MEDPRTTISKWIEEQREERNAAALAWVIQRAAFALLSCYPKGQGADMLWATFRMLAGAELEARGEQGEQGRLPMESD